MAQEVLHLQIRTPAAPGASLTIEQAAWPDNQGVLTARQAAAILVALQNGGALEASLNCPLQPAARLLVFPQPADLDYSLAASHGSLSGPQVEDAQLDEPYTVTGDSLALAGPVQELLGVEWLIGPYDLDGRAIPAPAHQLDGDTLRLAIPCAGGLRVRHSRRQHTYSLSMAPRPGALENASQATVYGIWAGGLTWHEMAPPPDSSICADAARWGETVTIEDGDDPAGGAPVDKKTKYDYCSGAKL